MPCRCHYTVKYVLSNHPKRTPKIGFKEVLSLNADQLFAEATECSAILPTDIKLPFVIKIFVLVIFELPLKTGFTVLSSRHFV